MKTLVDECYVKRSKNVVMYLSRHLCVRGHQETKRTLRYTHDGSCVICRKKYMIKYCSIPMNRKRMLKTAKKWNCDNYKQYQAYQAVYRLQNGHLPLSYYRKRIKNIKS